MKDLRPTRGNTLSRAAAISRSTARSALAPDGGRERATRKLKICAHAHVSGERGGARGARRRRTWRYSAVSVSIVVLADGLTARISRWMSRSVRSCAVCSASSASSAATYASSNATCILIVSSAGESSASSLRTDASTSLTTSLSVSSRSIWNSSVCSFTICAAALAPSAAARARPAPQPPHARFAQQTPPASPNSAPPRPRSGARSQKRSPE